MKPGELKTEASFLRSRVARRIFFLFVICAILPLSALAFFSFSQVMKQLNDQANRRLHQAGKAVGMAVYERLLFLETELKMIVSSLKMDSGEAPELSHSFRERLKGRFKGLIFVTGSGDNIVLLGAIDSLPQLSDDEQRHLNSGKTLVIVRPRPDSNASIFMAEAIDLVQPRHKILFGEVSAGYLLGEDFMSLATQLYVVDESKNILFSSFPERVPLKELKEAMIEGSSSGRFEWTYKDERYLAGYWSVFLFPNFGTPMWTVVQSQSRADILAPLYNFKTIFPLVVLLSFWVVLLLSLIQIRRTLFPLEQLKDGTRRLAMREFDSRVTVTSGDEFEELATSFNNMARRLGKQFDALTTMGEIDRAILSALDTEKIVSTVITRMHEVLSYDFISVTLLDSVSKNAARSYVGSRKEDGVKVVEDVEITKEDVRRFLDDREVLLINEDKGLPGYLSPFAGIGIGSFVVLPLLIKEELAGMIALGSEDSSAADQEDLAHARRLADQVAVALSNARLIEELDLLNWGILTALARAVDAKSPWTAGHSERVTEKALKIGQALGLSPDKLEELRRGALLHDIGKIGVPARLLDKAGSLTDEESQLIREHPRMGARILEPIAAYTRVIPLVLQHHERLNGTGYPDGRTGENISLGARILAVADSFDALVSDRPYRGGMDPARAVEITKQESGKKFDPDVVEAFLEVISQEEKAGR